MQMTARGVIAVYVGEVDYITEGNACGYTMSCIHESCGPTNE